MYVEVYMLEFNNVARLCFLNTKEDFIQPRFQGWYCSTLFLFCLDLLSTVYVSDTRLFADCYFDNP